MLEVAIGLGVVGLIAGLVYGLVLVAAGRAREETEREIREEQQAQIDAIRAHQRKARRDLRGAWRRGVSDDDPGPPSAA